MPRLALLVLSCLAAVASAAPLTLFYTSNRQGEVDPCGCPGAVQNGGIARMAAYLSTKKGPRFLGDAGDTFFSVATLLPSRREEELQRAHLIARAYRLMGVDAISPGERDFAEGVATLNELAKESGAKLVSANLTDREGRALFPATAFVDKNAIRIGVVGVANPTDFAADGPVRATPPEDAVREHVRRLRSEGAQLVVVLSHLGLAGDRALAAIGGIDLIVGAHSLDALARPELVNGARLVQPVYQGQQIGFVSFDSSSTKETKDGVIDLGKNWDRPGPVASLIAESKTERHQAAINLPDAKSAGNGFVAQAYQCQQCHQKQVDFWEKTKHASAYLTLYAKKQHFDPECIACHSVGYKKPGGFSSITAPIVIAGAEKRKAGETPFIEKLMTEVFAEDKGGALDSRETPERFAKLKARYHERVHALAKDRKLERLYADVQCENCHGSMIGHPEAKKKPAKIVEKTCRGCHTAERSPGFQWAWRALVTCPK